MTDQPIRSSFDRAQGATTFDPEAALDAAIDAQPGAARSTFSKSLARETHAQGISGWAGRLDAHAEQEGTGYLAKVDADLMRQAEDHIRHLEGQLSLRAAAPAEGPSLTDPNVVHLNMLRGTIAKPTWEQIKHLYPEQFRSPAVKAINLKTLADDCRGAAKEYDDMAGRGRKISAETVANIYRRIANYLDDASGQPIDATEPRR
jgi:hypothetical protein